MIQLKEQVVPIEVKAGLSKRIKSMQIFLDSHLKSSYGIRFWAGHELIDERVHLYPLYAIAKPLLEANEYMRKALMSLVGE